MIDIEAPVTGQYIYNTFITLIIVIGFFSHENGGNIEGWNDNRCGERRFDDVSCLFLIVWRELGRD